MMQRGAKVELGCGAMGRVLLAGLTGADLVSI